MKKRTARSTHIQRYLLAGVLTVIPVWITWIVFKFVLSQLSNIGMPWVRVLASGLRARAPSVSEFLLQPWLQPTLAVIITLLALYILGLIATRVVGRRIINSFDNLMERIPMVQNIYGATKKLVASLGEKPEKLERVVLINFPNESMKTVGFITRVMTDNTNGRRVAAVYVPTTPNPTSGYMEIVPVENLTPTDWTVEEAMTFIMSGGAVGPDKIDYDSLPLQEKELLEK